MGEIAVHGGVQAYAFDSQPFQQAGHDDGSNGIDRVKHHLETSTANCLCINFFQGEYRVDMLVGEVVCANLAQRVNLAEVELSALCYFEDFLALKGRQELALGVEQLEGVPLPGVMAGCNDDASVRSGKLDCEFSGRGGGEAALHHIHSASD